MGSRALLLELPPPGTLGRMGAAGGSANNPPQDPFGPVGTAATPQQGTDPYGRPWLFPPFNSKLIDFPAYIGLGPANGSKLAIVEFQIPPTYTGIIKAVANNVIGGGFTEGSGQVIWYIGTDVALGVVTPKFKPFQGYNNILGSLGNPSNPTVLPGFIRVYENQVVKVVVANQTGSAVSPGSPAGARLMGWMYSKGLENNNAWI